MPPPALDHFQVEIPDLLEVSEEDRPLVRDVISIMNTLGHPGPKLIRTWTVTLEGNYIIVHGSLDNKGGDWAIGFDDLDVLRQLDMYRVQVSIKGAWSGGNVQVLAKITSRAIPASVTEYYVTRVQKRRRWAPSWC